MYAIERVTHSRCTGFGYFLSSSGRSRFWYLLYAGFPSFSFSLVGAFFGGMVRILSTRSESLRAKAQPNRAAQGWWQRLVGALGNGVPHYLLTICLFFPRFSLFFPFLVLRTVMRRPLAPP